MPDEEWHSTTTVECHSTYEASMRFTLFMKNIEHTLDVFHKALLVPVEQHANTVFYLHTVCPSKGMQFSYVDELTRGAVRFCRVEFNGACKANGLSHEF